MPGHYKKKTKGRGGKMKIKPVHEKIYGMGHCQCGNGFFGDIVSGIGDLVTFKDPIRSLAAIGSLGMSEGVLAAEKITGAKGSDLIKAGTTIAGLAGMPELAVPGAMVSTGLKAIGHGKKKRRRRRRK